MAIWLGITEEPGAWLGWSKASRALVAFSVQRSAGRRGRSATSALFGLLPSSWPAHFRRHGSLAVLAARGARSSGPAVPNLVGSGISWVASVGYGVVRGRADLAGGGRIPLVAQSTPPQKGFFVGILCVYYGLVRFTLDFSRTVDIAGADARYLCLTPAQWGCIGLLAVGVFALAGATARRRIQRGAVG